MNAASNLSRIEGNRLVLRLVAPDDAGFIYALRTDPDYGRFLSPTTGTVGDQIAWIKEYKEREKIGEEFYYVIGRRDAMQRGLIRIYNIRGKDFNWGSWILAKNKPPKAALESAVLSFIVAFKFLELETARLDVKRENERAISFYLRFGMKETGRDEANIYFRYDRERFLADWDRYLTTNRE